MHPLAARKPEPLPSDRPQAAVNCARLARDEGSQQGQRDRQQRTDRRANIGGGSLVVSPFLESLAGCPRCRLPLDDRGRQRSMCRRSSGARPLDPHRTFTGSGESFEIVRQLARVTHRSSQNS